MMFWIAYLTSHAVSLTCVGAAWYLAANDRQGWGWFLVVALLCVAVVNGAGWD